MGRDLRILLRNKLRQVRNGWLRSGSGRSWQRWLAPLSSLVLLFFLGSGSLVSFRFILETEGAETYSIALEALASAFLGGMMLILINGMRQIIDTFFLSADLPLLLSTPLSRRAVFIDRFLEAMWDSGAYAAVLVLPPGVAFLYTFCAPWVAYLWLAVAFLLLLAGFVALSVLVDLIVARILPPSRVRQILISLNMLLLVSVILLYNLFSARIVAPEQALGLLSAGHVSRQVYMPTLWMARSLAALVPGYALSFWPPATLLIGGAGSLALLAIWLAGYLYARGWGAGQEAVRRRPRRSRRPVVSTRGGSPLPAFLGKDLRTFARDTRSWTVLLVGLVVLTFIVLGWTRDNEMDSQLTAVGMAALIAGLSGMFSARWQLGVFAQEGEAWWVIQAAPLPESALFDAKFLLNGGLLVLYNWAMVLLYFILAAPPFLWLPAAMVATAVLAAGVTAAGLAVAAWRTDMRQPQRQRRDVLGLYAMMGLVAVYVGLPSGALVVAGMIVEEMGTAAFLARLTVPGLTALLALAYLPLTAALWAGMRAWAVRSLQRLCVEQ